MKPQLPHRLRCSEAVSTEFAVALRYAMDAVPHARKQGARGFVDSSSVALPAIGGESIAKHVGTGFKVPLACAELYFAWTDGTITRPGPLAGLKLETVARLAVDCFLEELRGWRTKTQ